MGFVSDLLGTLRSSFRIGRATLNSSGLTAARALALPDKAGTIALLDDVTGSSGAGDAWIYGNGADGNITLGSTAISGLTSVSGSSPNWIHTPTRDIYAANLTIPAGVSLTNNGLISGFRVFVSGTLTLNGRISVNGGQGANGIGTTNGSGAGALNPGVFPAGNAGTAGGTTAATASTATTNAVGGRGGSGAVSGVAQTAAGNATPPATSAGGLQLLCLPQHAIEMRISGAVTRYSPGTGGTGGASSANGGNGGGGSAAGMLVVCAANIAGNGVIEAVGGAGGNASSSTPPQCGGGGGGGGFVALFTRKMTLGTLTQSGNIRTQVVTTPLSSGITVDVSGGAAGASTGTVTAAVAAQPGNLSIVATSP